MVSLKQFTIPHLQLQAAVLAASRQAKTIQEELRVDFNDVMFFMVSTNIVLAWFHSTSGSFKLIVSSRIGKIQSKFSNPSQCSRIFNATDDVSHRIAVQDLKKKWCNGPEFL